MQEPIPPRSHTSGWRRAWRGLWVTLTAKPTWTQAPRRDSGPGAHETTDARPHPAGSPPRGRAWLGMLVALGSMTACAPRGAGSAQPSIPPPPRLSASQVAKLMPPQLQDREGWARDVLAALEVEELAPSPPAVCSVLAVIEQESGYKVDPAVAGLPKMVRARLEEHANKLGPLGRKVLASVLEGRAKGSKKTFDERLRALRTERDLDRLFRDMLAYYENEFPSTFKVVDFASGVFASGNLHEFNPVTTAGSMQVSVRYAMQKAGEDADPAEVRESMYTRAGGVRYGTARLLGYEAAYPEPLFRFADYNAGVYASRNAALQSQVSRLTGHPLAPDGDLQLYDKQGQPRSEDSKSLLALLAFRQRFAPEELSERQVRRDVRKEKEPDFESTDTFRAVKRVYQRETGESPSYAQLPRVTLQSPKLKRELTTAWFARSVDQRFQKCMTRYRALTAK
ncbi:hypothetical protein MVI01_48130 [Myxococcus virescens]|uniref:DUF1615 domain-containing protein n=2 Tax=Myxococcus virescens TaxID=83456 RepID=A0A511HKH9_9BACT|nr:DUF1615 family protein [Myxococcus virescens]GEL73029.1 hypothetical protein MVI01_48130 [Myxococcus virescens]SDD42834.1 Protein of unknown function [Myxococcus virescens]